MICEFDDVEAVADAGGIQQLHFHTGSAHRLERQGDVAQAEGRLPAIGLGLRSQYEYVALSAIQPGRRDRRGDLQDSRVSRAIFACLLNTSPSTVQKWEIGWKKPTGTALKLSHLVQKLGLGVVA